MGYFQRRIDRGRSRELSRALHERGEVDRSWEAIPSEPPSRPCFVRFASLEIHADSRLRTGIFHAVRRASKHARGDAQLQGELDAAVDWFNVHLIVPAVGDERAIFLFKSTAKECMRRAWHLIACLRRAGAIVEMQTAVNPGRIVYEDELQVAVVPWADAELE
jgi:hypothetical protein